MSGYVDLFWSRGGFTIPRSNIVLAMFLSMLAFPVTAQNAPNTEQWEKFAGTWKRVPGPDDPAILKVEPEGTGVKFSFNCKPDRACLDVVVGNYDGKPYKDSGNPNWESSYRKTSEQTMEEDAHSSGKLSDTVKWQLSPDGNTLTRTYHYIDPPAQKEVTYAYDRSGGPASKGDLFIGFWKQDWGKSDPLVTTISAKGDGFTFSTFDGITDERHCDGKDHPDNFDATMLYSCRLVDSHTYDVVEKKSGKVILSLTRKVSDDGRKMVVTRKNAEGKALPEYVLEKVQ